MTNGRLGGIVGLIAKAAIAQSRLGAATRAAPTRARATVGANTSHDRSVAMPRKKSKRKKIQAEKRAQQPNGDHRGVKTIALVNADTAGLAMAMAVLAAGVLRTQSKEPSNR